MNEREIRRLVQPLLERNADLACHGRAVILTPIAHFLRAVLFERIGDKANVVASVELRPCFIGSEKISISFTTRKWPQDGLWWTGRSGFPEDMFALVERECLAPLRQIRSFDDSVALDVEYYRDGYASTFMRRAFIALARGRFGDAGAIFAKWDFAERFDRRVPGYGKRIAREGDDLPVEDKRAIIAILHRNEAAAIEAMKLEKHWTPTPFPAEEQGLV